MKTKRISYCLGRLKALQELLNIMNNELLRLVKDNSNLLSISLCNLSVGQENIFRTE